MRVNAIVILDPALDHGQCGMSIADDGQPDIVPLERLHEDFAIPLLSGLSTGVKQGSRFSATAMSMVFWAAKIEPSSVSHWIL